MNHTLFGSITCHLQMIPWWVYHSVFGALHDPWWRHTAALHVSLSVLSPTYCVMYNINFITARLTFRTWVHILFWCSVTYMLLQTLCQSNQFCSGEWIFFWFNSLLAYVILYRGWFLITVHNHITYKRIDSQVWLKNFLDTDRLSYHAYCMTHSTHSNRL